MTARKAPLAKGSGGAPSGHVGYSAVTLPDCPLAALRLSPDSPRGFIACPDCERGEYLLSLVESINDPPTHMEGCVSRLAPLVGTSRAAVNASPATREHI